MYQSLLLLWLHKHEVIRSAELGWAGLKNGDLIEAAESKGFALMITADQNLPYQQNLNDRHLAIIILPSGQWPAIKPNVLSIAEAVEEALPGTFKQLAFALSE